MFGHVARFDNATRRQRDEKRGDAPRGPASSRLKAVTDAVRTEYARVGIPQRPEHPTYGLGNRFPGNYVNRLEMPCCRRVARPARERQRARPGILWFLFALADRRSHRPTGEERQELLRNEVHEFPGVLLVLRKGPDRVRNRRGGLRERRRHARRPRSLRLRSARPVASCRNRKCRRTRGRPPASRRYPAAGEGRNARAPDLACGSPHPKRACRALVRQALPASQPHPAIARHTRRSLFARPNERPPEKPTK